MVAFGVSAVAVSAVFALVTWSLASQYLLRQREQSTLIQATSNARVVDLAVSEKDPTLPQLLTGLVSTPDSAVFVRLGGGWLCCPSRELLSVWRDEAHHQCGPLCRLGGVA